MIIIGFEDLNGNPIIKLDKEKKEFLEKSGYKEEEVIFADDIPRKFFVGLELISNIKSRRSITVVQPQRMANLKRKDI